MKTYFKVFKKFHVKDLPKTNYDCLKEEKQQLDDYTEQELLDKINADYAPMLQQTLAL